MNTSLRYVAILGLSLAQTGCYQLGSEIPLPASYADAVHFIGAPAISNPLPEVAIPAHPFMAPQGMNGMHSDSYVSQTYPWAGPLGVNPQVDSASFGLLGGECATVTFDSQGRLMTVCTDFFNMRLVLLDPNNLNILATHNLPLRESNKTLNIEKILNDSSGGAYFHLDNNNRPIIANAARHIQIFSVNEGVNGPTWQIDEDFDLNPFLPAGSRVTNAIPDWNGNIWFATRLGVVGVVNPGSGEVKTITLAGEEVQNATAVAENGVFIVSDHALYRFQTNATTGNPEYTWREVYDRGTAPKPGAINQGSGTTPTLLGNDLVAITDNADGRVNIVVYQRGNTITGDRTVCTIPIFQEGLSVTENSLIGYDHSLVVENNFGYTTPFANPWTESGLTRIDIRPDLSGCDVVWESSEASQTTVPKLSIGNGLIYLYTREEQPDPNVEAWYFTAVDFRTGETQFKILTGTGRNWNNNWAPITLGQDGTAYVGVLRGIISIKDGVSP